MRHTKPHSDTFGSLVGFVTFLMGIGLLLVTFKLAYDMFTVKPEVALGSATGKGIDVAVAGESLAGVLLRFVLLLIMAVVGSTIANRGIKLYVSARAVPPLLPEPSGAESADQGVSRSA